MMELDFFSEIPVSDSIPDVMLVSASSGVPTSKISWESVEKKNPLTDCGTRNIKENSSVVTNVNCNSKPKTKKSWTSDEDATLLELTKIHGTTNWTLIAEGLPNRSGKQCRERFHNHLQADIKKGAWTDEEDKLIVDLQAQYGNQWAKITKMLPGRTDNAVKNRWHAAMRSYNRLNDKSNCDNNKSLQHKGRKHPLVPFLPIASSAAGTSTQPSSTMASRIGEVSTSSAAVLSVSNFIRAVSPRVAMWASHEHNTHEHEPNSFRSDAEPSSEQLDNLEQYLSPRILEILLGPTSSRAQCTRDVSHSPFEASHVFDDVDGIHMDVDTREYIDPFFDPFADTFRSTNHDPDALLLPPSARTKELRESTGSSWPNIIGLSVIDHNISPRCTPRSPRTDFNSKKHRTQCVTGSGVVDNMKFLM